MRTSIVVALVGLTCLSGCKQETRLDASSLFALHKSTQSMKKELELSNAAAAALDNAVEVLVGAATRELLANQETGGAPPSAEAAAAEARVLAPIHELTLDELLAAAVDKRKRELDTLVAELDVEQAVIAEQQTYLDLIKVVRAGYGMSLATRRSWIDVTVYNGTEHTLTELVLDCRLVEPGSTVPREKGTCPLSFPDGLEPGTSRVAQTYVGWDTEPRSARKVEAWPIRALGANRKLVWGVPSSLNPMEAGRVGELRTRVTVVENSLRSLQVEPPASL